MRIFFRREFFRVECGKKVAVASCDIGEICKTYLWENKIVFKT